MKEVEITIRHHHSATGCSQYYDTGKGWVGDAIYHLIGNQKEGMRYKIIVEELDSELIECTNPFLWAKKNG